MAETELKKILRDKGLTLKEFAAIAGLSSRSLERYMCGKRDFDSARTWLTVRVADALGVDVHILLNKYDQEATI